MTAATASSHSSRANTTEIDGSTTSSIDETTSTESTTTEATTTSDSTTTTESTTTTTTTLATTPTTGTCNHGADVSKVAHEAPRGNGNEHGKAVSAAAHQKCNGSDDAADQAEPETGDTETHPDKGHEPSDEQGDKSGHDQASNGD
jgi:hypothetical protein